MTYNNIARAKMVEKRNKQFVLSINSTLNDDSGIYFLTRTDEDGIKYAYIGQAKHILTRIAQHLVGYQHIDLSIKKHGWYTDDNLCGWKIGFMNCPESELDKKEQHYIKMYAKHGYQLRNKTAGGQGQGKTQIDAYRPAKGYRDGIAQGKKTLARELSHIIDKHLTVTLQDGKEYNKVSQKAMEKFNALLDEKNY
ncbi:GIY-YIG nuclease family protein [Sellimonas intestinalis]|uniref:GIY-YIG nuclease family protein n=1 Tax=Sellimonas intestinalis TaxID=1653434 RepID=UPI000E404AB1|nr:GIY-YIG nuclease family protein [Sellimonas intestinalis]RGD36463.1 GIY-YIG nuclease family protein [Sellimonas intestinalis]